MEDMRRFLVSLLQKVAAKTVTSLLRDYVTPEPKVSAYSDPLDPGHALGTPVHHPSTAVRFAFLATFVVASPAVFFVSMGTFGLALAALLLIFFFISFGILLFLVALLI